MSPFCHLIANLLESRELLCPIHIHASGKVFPVDRLGMYCYHSKSVAVCVRTSLFSIYADIDECAENTDGCNQLCNNTIGSYFCDCNTGFELNDPLTCVGEFNQSSHKENHVLVRIYR